MGEDYKGVLEEGPPKFEVGDGPCLRPPKILRSTVIGCEAKHELTKKIFRRNLGFWKK